MTNVDDFTIENGVLVKYEGSDSDVIIPYGVTSIGESAFSECYNLTSITIPEGVISIGDYAFSQCFSLTSITLPDSVTSIGGDAFLDCDSLTSVTIPGSVTDIDSGAFERCSNLTTVTIPDSVTSIGIGIFSGCSCLTSVVIPGSVTSIDDDAFEDCSSLTNVTIPDGVTSIGDCAFKGCSSLISITLPDGVTKIGNNPFQACEALTNIHVSPDHAELAVIDGVLVGKTDSRLICCPMTKKGEYVIPEGIKEIGDNAFYNCSGLTSIIIPDSVANIGNNAFFGCSSLTSIMIPNSVTSIGNSAFSDCGSLTSIMIPDGVTVIDEATFSGCSSLTSIMIPDSVTSIGDSTFSGCSSLTSITIPGSVTRIGNGAFSECFDLAGIMIPDSVNYIGDQAFYGCTGLSEISVCGLIKRVGSTAFQRAYNFEHRKLADLMIVVRGKLGPALYNMFSKDKSLKTCAVYPDEQLCSEVPVRMRKRLAIRVADSIIQGHSIPDEIYQSYLRFFLAHITEWFDDFREDQYSVIQLILREKLIKITEIDSLIKSVSQKKNGELLNMLMAYQQENFGVEDYDRQTEKEFRKMERDATIRSDPTSQKYINAVWTAGRKEPYVKSLKEVSAVITFPTQVGKMAITGIADGFEFRGDDHAQEKVEEIVIPEGYTYIGSNAFYGCENLKKITLPGSIAQIGSGAFSYCSNLKTICFGSLDTWLAIDKSKWECTPLYFGGSLYFEGKCLKSLNIPEGTTNILPNAFEYCSQFTDVSFPDSVKEISLRAFSHCDGLTSVNIPENVRSIGTEAFSYCKKLARVTIQANITAIESSTFCQCKNLTAVEIPESVTSIGTEAFEHCEKLPEITIPSRTKSIGDSAFEGCKKLRTMELPKSVYSVGQRAFAESGIKALIVRSARLNLQNTRCMTGCRNYVIYAPKGSPASQYIPDHTLPLESLGELPLTDPMPAKETSGGKLAGLTFVVTGDMATWPDREDLKVFIESCGGRLTGSVSGKTDYLIANDQSSGTTKLQKAQQLGVKIIDENEFLKLAGKKQ